MNLHQSILDIALLAMSDDKLPYFVHNYATEAWPIANGDISSIRSMRIFNPSIDKNIRFQCITTVKPLDSVDVLEIMRVGKFFPELNFNKPTLEEAINCTPSSDSDNTLLSIFYEMHHKADYQLLAYRMHWHKGVIMIVKVGADQFIIADFKSVI